MQKILYLLNKSKKMKEMMKRLKLEKLKESMEDLDIDTADPIADYLYKYNWGDEMNEKVKDLKNAVTALDSDTVAELVDEILAAKNDE